MISQDSQNVNADLAAMAAWEAALWPSPRTIAKAEGACERAGLDYAKLVGACVARNDALLDGAPSDPGLARAEVARAISRAVGRMRADR